MKKILVLFSFIFSILLISSCNNNEKSSKKKSLKEYENIYADIDSKTQNDIETAYKEKFNKELKWCMPYEVDEFNSYDEIKKFAFANYGIRPYAKFDDTYVLCEYIYAEVFLTWDFSLTYDDVFLIGNINVGFVEYNRTILFKNNEIIAFNNPGDDFDLKDYLNISEDDALIIKQKEEYYYKKYYSMFIEEEKLSLVDINYRFCKLCDELYLLDHPISSKEENTDTTWL